MPGLVEDALLLGAADLDLAGNALANALTGTSGANSLNGRGGADVMAGRGVGDTYVVDTAADQVTEAAREGENEVVSRVDHVLAAAQSVEALRAGGSDTQAAIDLTGNDEGQRIAGHTVADTLVGLGGADRMGRRGGIDVLEGGAGADRFLFTASPGSGNADTILGFDPAGDLLVLDDADFVGLAVGALATGAFERA